MPDPRRGAAQVSLMWVIALCVISLVTVFFAYTSQQTSAELQASLDTARAGPSKSGTGTAAPEGPVSMACGWRPFGWVARRAPS